MGDSFCILMSARLKLLLFLAEKKTVKLMIQGHFMLVLFLKKSCPFPNSTNTYIAEVQFPE